MNFSIRMNSQVSTDAKAIFKMWLFLDRENIHLRNPSKTVVKDSMLFSLFDGAIDIKLDTLKSKRFDELGYDFYLLSLNNLKILKNLNDEEEDYLLLSTGKFDTFIIGINSKTGKSYRLSGFNGNDFFSLLADITEDPNSYPIFNQKISHKYFLNNFEVEKLNFKCLYEALRSKKIDRGKYPCLKRCSDPIVTH